ncbi:ATP-binding protein [Streptomyces sp. ITFR-21]|nr:ATP-binding protein [Streptomyces sp. ITFR-21]WNI18536.1 ATP-binding protein [Streptomyces sp. ITFR-21]
MSETRGLLRDHLRRWGVPALSDTVELLATELLTNALQHTGGGAVLTAILTPAPGHRLRVEVRDSVARRPRTPAPGAVERAVASGEHGTSGRGLILVEALADSWGAQAQGSGKVVWFELDARATAA